MNRFFYVNILFLVFYQAESDAIFRLLKLYVKDYIVLTLYLFHFNQIRPKEKKIYIVFNQWTKRFR